VRALHSCLALVVAAVANVACVNDDKLPIIPPEPPATLPVGPMPTATTSTPIQPIDGSVTPPIDAGPESGVPFSTGLGAGAVVTKSAKYTLITKTGSSPGGHGVSKTPAHTAVSGAASSSKK
jgi:hypothetical protein